MPDDSVKTVVIDPQTRFVAGHFFPFMETREVLYNERIQQAIDRGEAELVDQREYTDLEPVYPDGYSQWWGTDREISQTYDAEADAIVLETATEEIARFPIAGNTQLEGLSVVSLEVDGDAPIEGVSSDVLDSNGVLVGRTEFDSLTAQSASIGEISNVSDAISALQSTTETLEFDVGELQSRADSLENQTSGLSSDGTEATLQSLDTEEGPNNTINATDVAGSDLSAKISNALDRADNGQTIRVGAKSDGTRWQWDTHLEIDPVAEGGVVIDIDPQAEIDVNTDNDWALTFDSGGDISSQLDGSTVKLTGGEWFCQATDPLGFIRLRDLVRPHIVPTEARGFRNSSGDGITYAIDCVEAWTENWFIGGRIAGPDIGVDFRPASVTGGSGDESLVDGTAHHLKVHDVHNIGIRCRGMVQMCHFDRTTVFVDTEDATAWEFGGRLANTTLTSCKVEDPGGPTTGTTAYRTLSDFEHAPILIGCSEIQVETVLDKADPGHSIPKIRPRAASSNFMLGIQPVGVDNGAEQEFGFKNDGTARSHGTELYNDQDGVVVENTVVDGETLIEEDILQGYERSFKRGGTGLAKIGDRFFQDNIWIWLGDQDVGGNAVRRAGGVTHQPRGAPTTDELRDGNRMTYVSDGSDSYSAGDLVSARNDGGTIVSQTIGAAADDA